MISGNDNSAFLYTAVAQLFKEKIMGEQMKTGRKNTEGQSSVSTSAVIKVILGFFLVGNLLYAGIAFLTGDTGYIGEVLLKTGISVVVNIFLLLGADFCSAIENRMWKIKNYAESDLDNHYQTLKCSGGYYIYYLSVMILDLICIGFFWYWYETERESLVRSYQEGDLTYCFLVMLGFNLTSIFTFLRYNSKRVFYTRRYFCMVSFFRRETVTWSSLKKIEYCRKKKPRLVFTTMEKTIVVNSEIFYDGWSDFEEQVLGAAQEYQIHLICKN